MSQKTRKFFPNYRLSRGDQPAKDDELIFKHVGAFFKAKMPLFGATETQKTALQWAMLNTPPVISVWHEPPTEPDCGPFYPNHYWFHKSYHPYAMAIATLDCLGEDVPRKIKVYFCNYQNWNPDTKTMYEGKTVHVVPIT